MAVGKWSLLQCTANAAQWPFRALDRQQRPIKTMTDECEASAPGQ